MANSIVTKGLGPPGSIAEFLLRGLNPSAIAEMTPTAFSGQGSVGQLSGSGSVGQLSGSGSAGQISGQGGV